MGFLIKTVVLDPIAFRQELLTPFAQGPGVVKALGSGFHYHEGRWPAMDVDNCRMEVATAPEKVSF